MYESLFSFPGTFFGDFERLRHELDDLVGASGLSHSIRSMAPGTFPAINVGNTPQSLEIYAFVPGIDASKVDVTVDRGVLTLAGERPASLPNGNGPGAAAQASGNGEGGNSSSANNGGSANGGSAVRVYSRERPSGRFMRAISLPEDVDPGKVQATYRDGVLHISIARREAAGPTRIAIQ